MSQLHQSPFLRHSTILRNFLQTWLQKIASTSQQPSEIDWTSQIGKLNAALTQCVNVDESIDDIMKHFVYVPMRVPDIVTDIPEFLRTKVDDELTEGEEEDNGDGVESLAVYQAMMEGVVKDFETKLSEATKNKNKNKPTKKRKRR